MLYANPCEDRRGDILHYPEAVLPDGPPDSFSYEAILGRGKTMTHQRPFLHADKQTCRHEVEQRQIANAFACRVVKQYRLLYFRWYPHAISGSVLLKMNFIDGPQINTILLYESADFFLNTR